MARSKKMKGLPTSDIIPGYPTKGYILHDSTKADTSLPSSSTGSSYSADIDRNFFGECSLVSSEVDRWLSSEILAPLASREDSRLTNEIKRSKSFCYGELRSFSETESESKSCRCDLVPRKGKTKKVCDSKLEYSSDQIRKDCNISRSNDSVDEIYAKEKENFSASESEDNAKLIDKNQEDITVCPDEKSGSESDSLVKHKLVGDQNDYKGKSVSLIDESIIKHSGSETEDDYTDVFDDGGDDGKYIISVNNLNDSNEPVNQNVDIVQTDGNSLKTLTNSNDPGQPIEQSVNIVHSSNLSPEACEVKCVTVQVSVNSDEEDIRATPNQQKFEQLNIDQSPELHVLSNSYRSQDFVNSGGQVFSVAAVDTQVKEELNILRGSNASLETFGLYGEEFYFSQNSLQNVDRDKEQYLIEKVAITDDGRKSEKSNDDNADNIACIEEKFKDLVLDQKIRSSAKDSINEEDIAPTKRLTNCKGYGVQDEVLKEKFIEATTDLQNIEYPLETRSGPDFDKEDYEDLTLHPYPGINTEVKVDSIESTVVQTKIDCNEVTQEDNTLSLPDPSGEKTSLPECSIQASVEIQENDHHVFCNQYEEKEHKDNYSGLQNEIDSNTVKETEGEPACSPNNTEDLTEARTENGELSARTFDHLCEENFQDSEVKKQKEDNISDSVALSKELTEEQLISSHWVLHTLNQSTELKKKPLRHPDNISDNLLDENLESYLQNICDPCAIKIQKFNREEPLINETNSKSFLFEGGDANSVESLSLTEVKETGTDVSKEHVTSETTQSDKVGCGEKLVPSTLNISSITKHQEGLWKEKDSKSFVLENDVQKTESCVVNDQSLQVHCNELNNQREELRKDIDIALPIQSSNFKCQTEETALSSLEKSVPSEVSEQEKDNSNSYMYTSLNYKRCVNESHLCLNENLTKEKTERDENTIDSKDQTEETVCLKKDSQCCKIDNIDNRINISKESGIEYKPEERHYVKESIPGNHLTSEEVYDYSLEDIGKGILPPSQRRLSKTESEQDVGNLNQVKIDKEDLACESLISEKESFWTPNTEKSSVNAKSSKGALGETKDSAIGQKMEKDESEFTSDNRKTGKDKRSKKKRRMNSDSALLYEKSRYSLGILLEEIHDLVRKTQSFECSQLDIQYNPVKDVEGRRVDSAEKQIRAAKSDEKEKNLTTDSSNLLGFVELYTDVGKQGTDFSGSCKEATSENIILTIESNGSGPFQIKSKEEVESKECKMDSKLCKTDFLELSRELDQSGKERGQSMAKTKSEEKYEERPVVEDDSWRGKLRLVTDHTLQPGTETNPPNSRTEFSGIEAGDMNSQKDINAEFGSPQNSSVSMNKEQKRKFPLRMLRRKSVVTSLSVLDVDEVNDPSVGKRNTSDTDYSRQKETVGVYRNVSTDDIGRVGRENRSFSRDALDPSRSGDSFENIGRGRENANVYGWKKSPSKKLSSSSSYSESNHLTSSDQKNFMKKEASVQRSSSGISNSDSVALARQRRDSYSTSDKAVLSKSISSHLVPTSSRETRNDKYTSSKTLYREKTSDRRSDLSTLTSREEKKDRLSKRTSMDGSSTYGKHPYDINRIGTLSKAPAISTEGLSAFDKVVSKGKNASGNTCRTFSKDGPLSLHESTIMMNADTGQSPPKSERQSMEDTSQNPTEQMNGQINYDEICNIKNLKDEEMLQRVPELVQALRGLDEYDRAETMKILKSVGDTYWNFRAIRNKIGNALADEGFAEITMKILKTLNGKGIFKNDSIWFPVYYCFNTLWNYSDASLKLAKSIADHDGVRFFTINCDHEPYIKNLHSKNVYYVVKASMSILHNISRTTDIHHYFKENGTTEVMLKFATWKDLTYEMLKVMSLLTLAHIVEEEDNDKLIDETGAIESCIKYITKALKNSKRRHLGFTPQEVMDGLSKLAVNDKNKKKIIEAGALPVFLEMLKGEHTEEQAITARAIWNLSFDKEVCQQIVEYPEMIERLESLTNSQDKIVAKNVSGALFVLKGENDVSKRPKSAKKNKGHVFISYSWNEKEIVMKIRERLKKEGVEVWIDVERMGGSTLSAMAEAVENAALVLICMSEKYKESPNCRLEAEYTFQLRKEYIPLMVQKRYRPDGWLGMILGAKLYFDFSGKYPFEKPWNGLMKELKSIGRLSVLENPTTDKTDAPVSSSSSLQGSQPIRQSSTASKVYQMNTEDVSNWLCSLKLDGCVPSFAQFDGKLLAQLKSMKSEAAEFYYHCLEKNMNMNLVEILTFTEGLEKL